jgi:SH3-like domain-containing protein
MNQYWKIILILFAFSAYASVAVAERLAISAQEANMRSGPGTRFKTLWKVGKYHPFIVLEKSGSWYRFRDFEGDEGWVHKSLVSDIPTVITLKDQSNIRSGPGKDFKIVFVVEKGIPFKIIGRKGNWFHIQHADGDEGWIYKSLVWYEELHENNGKKQRE